MHNSPTSSLSDFTKWSRKERKDFLCENYEMLFYFLYEQLHGNKSHTEVDMTSLRIYNSDMKKMCKNKLDKEIEDKLIKHLSDIVEKHGDYIFGRGIFSDVIKTNTGRRGIITSPGNDVIKTNTGRRGTITSPGEGGRKRRKTIAARKRGTSKRNTRKNY